MTPLFHPQLINDAFGDPALYIQFLFEREAIAFDLGDLQRLSTRKVLRITQAFVSHAHIDHFCGFDRLLRIILGRGRTVRLFGPPGFADRVGHKLAAYSWNLIASFPSDLVFEVTEVEGEDAASRVCFRLKEAFAAGPREPVPLAEGVLVEAENYRIRSKALDHGIPCLAFALEEGRHVNVWKAAVEEMGFRVGPWLRELRRAVLRGEPDERPFRVCWCEDGRERQRLVALGELKERLLRIVPGQKIGYVVDAAYHSANAEKIVDLVRGADVLFIEAAFLQRDAAIAARKRHLTAAQAGTLARRAGVRELVPFHFSTRYSGAGDCLRAEAMAAFGGEEGVPEPGPPDRDSRD